MFPCLQCPKIIPLLLILFHSACSQDNVAQLVKSKASNSGTNEEALLNCGDLTDVQQMAKCVSKTIATVKKKAASRKYGYPNSLAPTLPPFLRNGNPADQGYEPIERQDNFDYSTHRGVQGYSEPQYRNFLDLETTLRPRIIEYRPVYYVEVPILHERAPAKDYYVPPDPRSHQYIYVKPVKIAERTYDNDQKKRKHTPRYQAVQDYNQVQDENNYINRRNYKYNLNRYTNENSYNTEYYVPANSPIIGDIRRSLLDYTGARDLMADEPEYLGRSVVHRVKDIQQDYYPFRRSGVIADDLYTNENKAIKVKAMNKP